MFVSYISWCKFGKMMINVDTFFHMFHFAGSVWLVHKVLSPWKGEQMTFTVNMICWKSGCLIKIGLPCRMKLTYLSVRQHLIWQNTCALSKNSWKLYKLMGFPHAVTARDSMLLRWQGHNLKAFWLQCRTNSIQGAFAPPKGPVKHQTTTCGRIIWLKAIWKKRRSRPCCCKGIPKKERLGPSWSTKHKYRTRKKSYLLETLTLAHSAERQLACLESKKSCESF